MIVKDILNYRTVGARFPEVHSRLLGDREQRLGRGGGAVQLTSIFLVVMEIL